MLLESIAHGGDSRPVLRSPRLRELECDGGSHHAREMLRSSAPSRFLTSTVHDRSDRASIAHVEDADAGGAAELVRREAHEIDGQRIDVDRQPARCLDRVTMKRNAATMRDRSELCDRFDAPDLVVRIHDARKCGLRSQRGLEALRVDDARSIDGQQRHVVSCALE